MKQKTTSNVLVLQHHLQLYRRSVCGFQDLFAASNARGRQIHDGRWPSESFLNKLSKSWLKKNYVHLQLFVSMCYMILCAHLYVYRWTSSIQISYASSAGYTKFRMEKIPPLNLSTSLQPSLLHITCYIVGAWGLPDDCCSSGSIL